MSTSSKIALAMSADGASFEEVHTSLEKITDKFAIDFAEWYLDLWNRNDLSFDNNSPEQLLEIFKKEKGL